MAVELLLLASVAVQVTVVVPIGKIPPAGALLVTIMLFGAVQLSDTAGAVKAIVMGGTSCSLIVNAVLRCRSDGTEGLRAMSTSPRLSSTGMGEGSMLMLCTSFGMILALFLVSMLAFENHPGFLLDASCLRIASRFSGSLAERTASASRAS